MTKILNRYYNNPAIWVINNYSYHICNKKYVVKKANGEIFFKRKHLDDPFKEVIRVQNFLHTHPTRSSSEYTYRIATYSYEILTPEGTILARRVSTKPLSEAIKICRYLNNKPLNSKIEPLDEYTLNLYVRVKDSLMNILIE